MGSCVSTAAESVSVHALPTAKVVDLDGAMAQFAGPVTALEALAATAAGGAPSSSSSPPPPRFLCCSDALDFDAPVAAMAAHDALRPGQLYFALPMPMLGRPLSAQAMAALAVTACAALGAAPLVAAAAAGTDVAAPPPPPSLDRSSAAGNRRQHQRWQAAGRRVAPLVVVSADDAHGELKSYLVRGGGGGGETAGKTRNGVGFKGAGRDVASVRRLSVIVEAATE